MGGYSPPSNKSEQTDRKIMHQFLDEVQLGRIAPSIFAAGGSQKTSSRYSFIPTIDVVRGMKESGFYPVSAQQSRCRLKEKRDHVKHILRFRHESALEKEGVVPEIVLVNSHDGTASYQLRAGVYRIVCCNGIIAGDEIFCRRIHHKGDVIGRVVEAAEDLIEIVPLSVERVREWEGISLTKEQQVVFSEAAATLRWDKEEIGEKPLIQITHQLLDPKRIEDKKSDLWTTMNVVQENIMRGGKRYRTEGGSRQRTREVNSVNENVRLNTALWMLTEKMAQLVK